MPPAGSLNAAMSAQAEYLPLDSLIDMAENRLNATVKRGFTLPLYKRKWTSSGFNKKNKFDLSHLKSAPFTSREDLAAASRDISHVSFRGEYVHLWTKHNESDSANCWVPHGLYDIDAMLDHAGRVSRLMGVKLNDCILFLNQQASNAANLLPYAMLQRLKTSAVTCQVITLDMDLMQHVNQWIGMLMQNPPAVIVAQGDDVLDLHHRLLELKASGISAGAENSDSAHGILPKLRLIQLYGKDAASKQKEVRTLFNAETRLSLGLADPGLGAMECEALDGLHLWMDKAIYEIIPEACGTSSGQTPSVPWLWESPAGTRGELVVTSFSELFPLVRYRSGYRVESMGNSACACGRTHPRIKLLA